MKRLLLPAGALVLVLTACGAGAKPAPRVAEVGAIVERPPAGSSAPTRFLTVTAVALPARTVIRAHAQVEWIYQRAPSEKVPSATSAIVIHGYKLSKKITDPAEVGRIVRWFDVLPIEPTPRPRRMLTDAGRAGHALLS